MEQPANRCLPAVLTRAGKAFRDEAGAGDMDPDAGCRLLRPMPGDGDA